MCISFHRLCVCASGSLMTSICNFSARIKLSFLHLGQKRGKFINTVSSLIWFRVLCPQAGQSIHSVFIQYAFHLLPQIKNGPIRIRQTAHFAKYKTCLSCRGRRFCPVKNVPQHICRILQILCGDYRPICPKTYLIISKLSLRSDLPDPSTFISSICGS